MKKIILVVATSLLLTTTASAGLWDKLTTINNKVINPTTTYNIETSGWNIRVVEWIPDGNKNIRCMFAGGESKGGVACYPISKSVISNK